MTGADVHKCAWINEICNSTNIDFVSLQEHFKTVKSTEQWFRKQFNDWQNYVIPAFREPGVDCGRGRGGLVQLSSKKINFSKHRIICQSPRIQAQILVFSNIKIL